MVTPIAGEGSRPSDRGIDAVADRLPPANARMVTRVPTTRYARAEGGYVAYQVFGDGPIDILFIGNWASNIEIMWEEPSLHRYFDRLASIGRVACFDKRGVGVSDPVPLTELPTLEQWMDDARVVLDVLGWRRVAVIGDAEGGPMAMLFSASFPDRVTALVLVNTFARMLRADDYPIGMPSSAAEKLLSLMEQYWGTGELLALTAPTAVDDSRLRQWMARYMRLSAPLGASRRLYGWVLQLDVRSVLSSIQAPTLVIHRAENLHYRPAQGRYLAERIPGARYVEVPGPDWYPPSVNAGPTLDEIEEFLTGERPARKPDRILATVMFTDIVASSERAADIGDNAWLDLRHAHDALVRAQLERFRGREVETAGDGFLATFDGPAAPSSVRPSSSPPSGRWISRSGRASTRVRSSSETKGSAESRSTSPHGSCRPRHLAGWWCRRR